MPSIPFELHVMKRMAPAIRAAALDSLRLSPEEGGRLEASCPIRIPDRSETLFSAYEDLLGPPVMRQLAPAPAYPGATEHRFILALWPHLFWSVREAANGQAFSVGFESQFRPPPGCLRASSIRPELVTLDVVRQASLASENYDGWDEEAVVRFRFAEGDFEGRFVWNLLQEWRRLDPTG